MKLSVSDDDEDLPTPGGSRTYPVGIVGEASYQPAIRCCSAGQHVQIVHELGNPYDKNALAVVTESGETLGYIARDCWLQDAIHGERHGCEATIKSVNSADVGNRGLVLDVSVGGSHVPTRQFNRPPAAAPSAPAAARTGVPKGWFAKLFGL
jgi:hypothetical protein